MSNNKQAIEWLREHARHCNNRATVESWRNGNERVRCTEAELASYFADQIEALEKPWATLTSARSDKPTGVKIMRPTRLEKKIAARMKRSAKSTP